MKKQEGAALIVSLVFLVVALLLGLSSIQSSRLEESMTGNYRAVTNALMAAEYGEANLMSAISDINSSGGFSSSLNSGFVADLDSHYSEDLSYSVANESDHGYGAYFEYTLGVYDSDGNVDESIFQIPVIIDGIVYSGDVDNPVSERRVSFIAQLDGLGAGNLSPLNFAANLDTYEGIRSQADLEGEFDEEVAGFVNPAVSAASRQDAREIVWDITGYNESNGEINDKFVFIPDDGEDFETGDGRYYAAGAVDYDPESDSYTYTGNYDNCNSGQNRMCNYKGGVSTKTDDILSDANLFHNFVNTLFSEAYVDHSSTSLSGGMSGMNIVSQGDHLDPNQEGVYYYPQREITQTEEGEAVVYPERHAYDGSGGGAGDGVLVIDGDVEFNGDPEFEGIIIVLGDYTVNGGGGGDFRGAIVSAPYSCLPGGGCDFDPVQVDISGGGSNDYLHVMEALNSAWQIMQEEAPNAARQWFLGNLGDGNIEYNVLNRREIVEN